MTLIIKYRNRLVTQDDISFIRKLISNHPEYGRCALSRQICRDWNWAQANGQLKDMVCRGLLLLLEKQDYIKLPPRKKTPKNPFIDRKPPEPSALTLITPPCTGQKGHHLVRRCFFTEEDWDWLWGCVMDWNEDGDSRGVVARWPAGLCRLIR